MTNDAMKCREARGRLSAYQDGELAAGERDGVDAHLGGCATCRAELQGLKETWRALDGLGGVEAPADFADRVLRRIRPAGGRVRPVRRRWFPWSMSAPVPAVSLSVLGLLAGITLGNRLTSPPGDPGGAAGAEPRISLASLADFDPFPPGSLAADYARLVAVREDPAR